MSTVLSASVPPQVPATTPILIARSYSVSRIRSWLRGESEHQDLHFSKGQRTPGNGRGSYRWFQWPRKREPVRGETRDEGPQSRQCRDYQESFGIALRLPFQNAIPNRQDPDNTLWRHRVHSWDR